MANQKTQLQELAQSNPRITGIFILLFGAAILYFTVAEPVLHAQVGSHIYISAKGGFIGGIFTILGLILVLFGSPALNSMQAIGSGSKATVISGVILGVVGIIAIQAFKSYLRTKGYIL